jgi:predicted Zn-dependent protease
MDRLQMLRKMVEAKPDDPFPRYGLAMELRKHDERAQAREAFEALVERHPDYVATYLMFGNLLVELGEADEAKAIYDRGIEAATRAGDDHARSELQAARAEVG